MQVYSHATDQSSEEEQLATLNLSLKSIEGGERQLFSSIEQETTTASNQIQDVANINIQVRNYVRNLTNACKQLIQGEYQLYNFKNRAADFRALAREYGYTGFTNA